MVNLVQWMLHEMEIFGRLQNLVSAKMHRFIANWS